MCRHCGNELDSADPIENGWVAYESVPIITKRNLQIWLDIKYGSLSEADIIIQTLVKLKLILFPLLGPYLTL